MKRILIIMMLMLVIAFAGVNAQTKAKPGKTGKKAKPEKVEQQVEPKEAVKVEKKYEEPKEEKTDVTKKPEPLPANEFTFPEYSQATLKNGLKVFIIEDHEQPLVSFRLLVPSGTSMDGDKPGLAEMTASLLNKGFGQYSALDIAKKLDGIGASISANAGVDYISVNGGALKKHMPLLMQMYAGMILDPSFSKDEYEKLVPQFIASIQQEKASPGTIAAALARRCVFGNSHPYAISKTEASVKDLEVKDVKKFFKKYFIPNNSSLAVIGDVTKDEVVKLLNSAFENWKDGTIPEIKIEKTKPQPIGVYFAKRPASVQSSVVVTTAGVPVGNANHETLDIAASVIGAGFAGRLFRTLRETYSYTYTPFGYLTRGKYAARFACGADVRNSVTDSALNVINEQLRLLATVPATPEEINRVKKYEVGSYLMSFENSDFIAGLIQDADFYGINIEKVKSYPQRIMAIDLYEIKDVAEKYMNPKNSYIVVVGAPEVREKLEKFGKIYDFDLDLNPISGENAKMEKVSLDAEDLLEKFAIATGGEKAIKAIQSITDTCKATMTISGKTIPGTIIQIQKAPNKKYMLMDLGFIKQEVWVDGKNVWANYVGTIEELKGENKDMLLFDAVILNNNKLLEIGYKCKVLGKQGEEILMKAVSPKAMESTYYFDAKTYLLNRVEKIEKTDQGTMPVTEVYKNYIKVGELTLPGTIETTNPMYYLKVENKYSLNNELNDALFTPVK